MVRTILSICNCVFTFYALDVYFYKCQPPEPNNRPNIEPQLSKLLAVGG